MKMHLDPSSRQRGKTDWARIDALTDEQIEAAASSDPDCPPLTDAELTGMQSVADVKSIRGKLDLTQEEFAAAFHLPLAILRDWEQGRARPGQAAKTLLRVIAAIPGEVKAALQQQVRPHPRPHPN